MPINNNLLVAAPMLQDLLVDKTGIPMSGGIITCYHDKARTTLKNWYYQTGTPVQYNYVPLPNPLTLSAAGTICDINGVDTIPFFYPFLETNGAINNPSVDTYYIYIESHDASTIITRENFPFTPSSNAINNSGIQFNNLIVNSYFWRNIAPNNLNITPFKSVTLTGTLINSGNTTVAPTPPSAVVTPPTLAWTDYGILVAPSQHDGFSMPDIKFYRNTMASTDTVTFVPFPLNDEQLIADTIFPEYYLSHVSTASSGESFKYYQIPIDLHLNKLQSAQYTVYLLAMSPQSVTITLQLLEFCGSGQTSPAPVAIATTPLTLSTSWTAYQLTDIFPGTLGQTLSSAGDDAWYLQIALPINANYTVNFAKPSLFLTDDEVPGNDFQTYDQISPIINGERTGDIRISLNAFYSYGWAPMNDGYLGLPQATESLITYSRGSFDTWPLYSLLWNYAKQFDTGATFNYISQMAHYNGATYTLVNYGANAYTDFIANNLLTLTQTMGRALLGSVPPPAFVGGRQLQIATFSTPNVVLGTNSGFYYTGQPISFVAISGTLPAAIQSNAIYFMTRLGIGGANTFALASNYGLAIAQTADVVFGTAAGTFEFFMLPQGATLGETGHLQQLNELFNHTHNAGTTTTSFFGQGTGFANPGAGAGANFVATTGPVTGEGTQLPFNIYQPSNPYNMFIKL